MSSEATLSKYNKNKLMYLSTYNTQEYVSLKENVNQLNERANNKFTLLIIWFIITIIIFIVTIFTLLNENSLNPIVIVIVTLFLFYVLFYFSTTLYNMFK